MTKPEPTALDLEREKTRKVFVFSLATLLVVAAIFVPLGVLAYRDNARKTEAARQIGLEQQKTRLELEQQRTKRSAARWQKAEDIVKRFPFTRKD